MCVRIVLADDHAIIRQGLSSLIDKQPGMEVIGQAKDGREAIEIVKNLVPNIVIMDISMPNLNGIEATRSIHSEFPDIKIIALSMHSNKRFISNMLTAGATGYILKDTVFDELVRAIHIVASGRRYLSTGVADIVVSDYVNRLLKVSDISSNTDLTCREREVLQLVAEGKSIKQIALELHVSTKTIEANRRRMMEKLGLRSVAELTKYAIREGITTLE